jgi:hypothetical protein
MGLTIRPLTPASTAIERALVANRTKLINQWSDWLASRMAQVDILDRPTSDRQVALLIDVLIEKCGPLRSQVGELWFDTCDSYGRTAAARGLAAGEVVEEIQYLRELLIRHLSEIIAALQARQSMAAVLRLNRIIDQGIAHAVVGYTDVLVESLLNQRGIAVSTTEPGAGETTKRLEELEKELNEVRSRRS